MNHLELLNWNTQNRIDKIEHILTVLNRFGTASIEFYNGKPHKFLNHFGRGDPQSVDKDDEWDYAKIIYNNKILFEIFEFQLKIFSLTEGYFYEEHFTEEEKKHIFDAIDGTEIIVSREYFSRGIDKWLIPVSILIYSSITIFYIIYGTYYLSFLFFCCLLISLYLFRRGH